MILDDSGINAVFAFGSVSQIETTNAPKESLSYKYIF